LKAGSFPNVESRALNITSKHLLYYSIYIKILCRKIYKMYDFH
jgi:hypothetical protein